MRGGTNVEERGKLAERIKKKKGEEKKREGMKGMK